MHRSRKYESGYQKRKKKQPLEDLSQLAKISVRCNGRKVTTSSKALTCMCCFVFKDIIFIYIIIFLLHSTLFVKKLLMLGKNYKMSIILFFIFILFLFLFSSFLSLLSTSSELQGLIHSHLRPPTSSTWSLAKASTKPWRADGHNTPTATKPRRDHARQFHATTP